MTIPYCTITGGDGLYDLLGTSAAAMQYVKITFTPNIKEGHMLALDDAMYRPRPIPVLMGPNGNFAVDLPSNDPRWDLDTPLEYTVTFSGLVINGKPAQIVPWTFIAPSAGEVVPLDEIPRVVGSTALGSTRGPRGYRSRLMAITSGPDEGKYQWVDEHGTPFNEPVDRDIIIPESIAYDAVEEVAPAAVDADLASREIGFVDEGDGQGHFTVGGVPVSGTLVPPAATWSGVAGRDDGVKKATGGIVPIERFNPDTNGFAAALSAALDEAHSTGGTVVFEAGKTYIAEEGITKTDIDIRLNANGAKIVRAAAMPAEVLLSLQYGNSAPQSVTGLTNTTYTFGGGGIALTTRISVSDTTGWAAGDWAVIVSEDPVPGRRPSVGNKEGERVQIAGVTSSYLYTTRPLRVTLTTGIRIARLTQKEVRLENLWVEDDPASTFANRTEAAVRIFQAVKPVIIEARMRNLLGEGINVNGCVAGVVNGLDVHNLRTSTTDGVYGYGIRLMSSCDFEMTNIRGNSSRNIVATGGGENPSDTSPYLWRYGSTIGNHVQGSSIDAGGPSFSTHDEAAGIHYHNLFVGGHHGRPGNSMAGVHLSGRDGILQNSITYGRQAFYITGYDGGGRHKVINHTHVVPPGWLPGTDVITDDAKVFDIDYGDRETNRGEAEVSGKIFVPEALAGTIVNVNKASLRIPDLLIRAKCTGASFGRLFLINNSDVIIDSLTVDLRGSTSTPRIFRFLDSTSTLKIGRLSVITGGAAWRLFDLSTNDATIVADRIEMDSLPLVEKYNPGANVSVSVGEYVLNGRAFRDAVGTRTNTNIAMNEFIEGTQVLDEPISNNRTITEPSPPAGGRGDVLWVRTANATGSYVYGSGNLLLATPGTWVRRKWNGTAWVTTARGFLAAAPSGTANLNFPSISAQSYQDLTITVTGAALGDAIALGVPTGAITGGVAFTAWVSAADTVTVRAHNYTSGALNPDLGVFKATVVR